MNGAKEWVLILGGSSGIGLATAKKLARHGFHLIIVHRDRKADLEDIESEFHKITSHNVQCVSFNQDALNPTRRKILIDRIASVLDLGTLKMLVHSIAKGNLKPMGAKVGMNLQHQDYQLTMDAMAISLYDWVSELHALGLFSSDARVVSFTSEGNAKAWPGYGAVSAAKAALEAITRNIAVAFAGHGIKANCIQAGVTNTRSFRMIPDYKTLLQVSIERNPYHRLTTPEDVADVVYLLSKEEARWITGTVIKVDGGESLC
ncbi:MAG: SDR family oxidoreductase [Bacteroidota bacterium]